MATSKQISGALSQLRSEALKQAQQEIKKVAATIVENQRGIRVAQEKADAVITEHNKSIEIAEAKAAEIVATFEADWGPWDNKLVEVTNGAN